MNLFDWDNWAEIFSTIGKNKLRTFLTGFSISWGIFMFCILLSAGNGMRNGVMSLFGNRSTNSMQLFGGSTSIPYKGLPENRIIKLEDKDLNLVGKQLPEVSGMSGIIHNYVSVNYQTFNSPSCDLTGITPEYQSINGVKIKDNLGRFINNMDMKEFRKVMVINQRLREILFPMENPIGKQVIAGQLGYTVIGVFEENSWGNNEKAYIPFSTAQLLYNNGWGINDIVFTVENLDTEEDNQIFEKQLRGKMARLHTFSPDDHRAVYVWNRLEDYLQTVGIFNGISAFIWIIGIGTLIAGIVSVSNIMLITVRERTREFGIRKALGAKPASILGSILIESAVITSLFGYVGMMLGIAVGELANKIISGVESEMVSHIVKDPTIEVNVAIGAMLLLVISGIIAGYFPALKAVKISPVEAMREE